MNRLAKFLFVFLICFFSAGLSANAAIFVQDNLADTAGVFLQNHTGTTGATWTKHSSVSGEDFVFSASPANHIRNDGTSETAYYASGIPSSADYDVQATVYAGASGATGYVGLIARADTSAKTYYLARYFFGSSSWVVLKFVNGSATTLGSYSQALTNGTKYDMRFALRGSRLILYINGVPRVSADDSSITAAGRVGVGGIGVGTQNDSLSYIFLQNFIASDPGFVEDTMIDTAGVFLQNHTGNTGATWTKHPAAAGDDFVFTTSPTSYIRNAGVGSEVFYYSSGVPTSADYDVQANFLATGSNSAGYTGILGRCDTTNKTAYMARYFFGTNTWQLYSWVGGTATLLGSYAEQLLDGQSYNVKLSMRGTAITLFVDGVSKISVNNSAVTAAGRAGIAGIAVGSQNDASAKVMLRDFSSKNANVISVANSNIFFSPYNWYVNGTSYAEANNSGPYFKLGFTGTNISLNMDQSGMSDYPIVAYSIDGGAISRTTTTATTTVTLNSGILSPGSHQITVYVDSVPFTNGSLGSLDGDRYTPVDRFRLLSIDLDQGASTLAPTLKTKRVLVYGASIEEGSVQTSSSNTTATQRWSTSWDKIFGDTLDAEVGAVAYQGQGYEKTAPYGGTPGFIYSYNLLNSSISRTFSPEPDYVFIDQGNNAPPTVSASDVTTSITNLRAVMPNTVIYTMIPFSQVNKTTMTNAFNSQSDTHALLIDLGTPGADAITNNSFDGSHPNATGHNTLAGLVYAAMDLTAPTLSSISSGTPTETAATITWTSNEVSDSKVEYGTSISYGSNTTVNPSMVTSHSVGLSALTSGTLYHYRVISKDRTNNSTTSPDQTFTTASSVVSNSVSNTTVVRHTKAGHRSSATVSASGNVSSGQTSLYSPVISKTIISRDLSELPSTYLREGAKRAEVITLQKFLATLPDIYPEKISNGSFGPLTKKAVQRFQLKYGVVSSKYDAGYGIVGPKTLKKISDIFQS